MAHTLSDDDLELLFPDYLNNALTLDERKAVDAYLQRSEQARIKLENFQLISEHLDLDDVVPAPNPKLLNAYLDFVNSNPIAPQVAPAAGGRWYDSWRSWSWTKSALTFALFVIIGQGVVFDRLNDDGESVGFSTRSATGNGGEAATSGVVLNVQFDPEAQFADVMAAVRSVNGRVVSSGSDSAILFIRVSSMPAQDAIKLLKQSKAILSIVESPNEP